MSAEPGPWLGRAQWERDEEAELERRRGENFPLTTAKHERHPMGQGTDEMAQAERWAEVVGRVGQLSDDAAEQFHRQVANTVPEWPTDRARIVKAALHEAVLALRRAREAAAGGLEIAQLAVRRSQAGPQ